MPSTTATLLLRLGWLDDSQWNLREKLQCGTQNVAIGPVYISEGLSFLMKYSGHGGGTEYRCYVQENAFETFLFSYFQHRISHGSLHLASLSFPDSEDGYDV